MTRRTLPWLGLYALLSVLLFGLHVVGHLDTRLLSSDPVDSSQFTWFLAWWPHAIAHGLNPFLTHAMFAPEGYNLAWSTAMPVPALLLAPVTVTAGPVVAYDLIQLASPALSAWAMFLLCRHVTRGRTAPSLAGGFVYGFSPYVGTHLTGAPHVGLVALLPVAVLLVLRRLEGSLGTRGFVAWMTALLVAQGGTSLEVLALGTLFAALALAVAFALLPERRGALAGLARWSALAYALAVAVLSPYLYYLLFGPRFEPVLPPFAGDLLSPVMPTALVALAPQHQGIFREIAGAMPEDYLGAPLLVLLALYAWRYRRERVTWLMVAVAVAAIVATFGGHLKVLGHHTGVVMPWEVMYHLPLLEHAIASRAMVFALVPAAVVVALWLARGGGAWRWALALAALAAIFPYADDRSWSTDATDPAFFRTGQYRAYLHQRDRVLTIPVMGPNQRWQANTDFGFQLTTGYGGTNTPRAVTRFPIWTTLTRGRLVPRVGAELRRFVAAKGVTAVVVDASVLGPWARVFGTLGVRPQRLGGIVLYRLTPA